MHEQQADMVRAITAGTSPRWVTLHVSALGGGPDQLVTGWYAGRTQTDHILTKVVSEVPAQVQGAHGTIRTIHDTHMLIASHFVWNVETLTETPQAGFSTGYAETDR